MLVATSICNVPHQTGKNSTASTYNTLILPTTPPTTAPPLFPNVPGWLWRPCNHVPSKQQLLLLLQFQPASLVMLATALYSRPQTTHSHHYTKSSRQQQMQTCRKQQQQQRVPLHTWTAGTVILYPIARMRCFGAVHQQILSRRAYSVHWCTGCWN